MSGRGTTDGIYIVKCIHQITDKMKNLADALLINLVAALDYVNKDVMFKTDFQRFTPISDTNLIQLMELLYSYTRTAPAQTLG